MFNLGTEVGVIDSVAILNHNLNTVGGMVRVEMADDNAFTVNLKTCEVQTPATNKRMVFLDLDDTANAAITAFANAGGGQVTVTAAGHGLSTNDAVTIQGTTSYNGTFTATNIVGNDFEITDGWVANDATGWTHNDTDGGQLRYSSVRYVRLAITLLTDVPTIGEVVFSRRRQLKHKPQGAWDKNNLQTNASRSESASGVITDYVFNKKRRKVSALFTAHEDAYINDLVTFFEDDIDGGYMPFLLIDDPGTSPTDANWLKYTSPEQTSTLIGYTQREFPIVALEHGPNFLKLES